MFLAGINAPLTGDELAYQQIAVNLAAGRGFVQNNNPFFPGQLLYAWQAPLYPLSLGLLYRVFGPHLLVAKLFGILTGVVAVWVVYDLARRIFPEPADRSALPKIPLLAALIVAIYPGLLTNSHLLLTETLFTLLLVVSFDFFVAGVQQRFSVPLLIASGVAWGLATLTRGITLYFVLPLALWLVLFSRRAGAPAIPGRLPPFNFRAGLRSVLALAVAMVIVIAPWTWRNYTVFHQFVSLETKGGVNFWLGNSPYTPDDFIRNVWKIGVRDPMLAALPSEELARDRTGYALGIAFVTREPLRFLSRMPVKFADFWGFERSLVDVAEATRDGKPGGWSSPVKMAADFLSDAVYVLLVLAAIGGFFFAPDDRWKLLIGGFVLYFVAVHIVVFGDGRFHFPLVPFLALYSAWLLVNGIRGALYTRWRLAGALCLALIFVVVWAHEILAAARILTG
ncbi:MAG: glycosyltransferase family 39 protein [Anaerolineae bacterium]